jgi:signal transduction histidine kinase
MMPRSLRLRLLGGAALWILLALLIAGLVIGWAFRANVERQVQQGLVASLNRLVAQIDPFAPVPVAQEALPDPRYATPFSGLYWQVEDVASGESWRSRSLWDQVLAPSAAPGGGGELFVTLPGPESQSLSALLRDIRFAPADDNQVRRFRVTLAENRALLDESIRRFGTDLAIALAVLALALIAAAALQVRLGLRPLQSVRAGISAVRRGEAPALPPDYPAEVLPLVAEVNELLGQQQKSIDFARARASDLAHGLKTPLSVLQTLGAALADKGDVESAKLVDDIASEMDDRVDYQLRLSRLRLRTRAHQLSASLNEAVDRTLAVLVRTRDGERLAWRVELSPGLVVDIDRHDLTELVGVMLENAAKWGNSTVRIEGRAEAGNAILCIADDGPGLSEAEIGKLGVRGQRLDEKQRGSGLGIAIALEIVAINSGTVSFGRAPEGGLAVRLALPLVDGAPIGVTEA